MTDEELQDMLVWAYQLGFNKGVTEMQKIAGKALEASGYPVLAKAMVDIAPPALTKESLDLIAKSIRVN